MAAEIETALLGNAEFIRGLARSLAKPGCSDDLAQDLYLAALRRPPKTEALPHWLVSTARRLTAKAHRSEFRRRNHETGVRCEELMPSTLDVVTRNEANRRISETVLALPEIYRTVLLLRYYEGVATEEIARRLSLSPVAVRARLWRGIDSLRQTLQSHSHRRGSRSASALSALGGGGLTKSSIGFIGKIVGGSLFMPLKVSLGLSLVFVVAVTYAVWPEPITETQLLEHSTNARNTSAKNAGSRTFAFDTERFPQGADREQINTTIDDSIEDNLEPSSSQAILPGLVSFNALDAITREPIHSASVRFQSALRFGVLEGASFGALTPDVYTLSVRAPGYTTVIIDRVTIESEKATELGDIALWRGTGSIEGDVQANDLSGKSPINVELHGWIVESCFSCHQGETSVTPRDLIPPVAPTSTGCMGMHPRCEVKQVTQEDPSFRFEGLPDGVYYLRAVLSETKISDVQRVQLNEADHKRALLKLEAFTSHSFYVPPPHSDYWRQPKSALELSDEPPEEDVSEEEESLIFEFIESNQSLAMCEFNFQDLFDVAYDSSSEDPSQTGVIDRPRTDVDTLTPEFPRPTFAPLKLKGTFVEPAQFIIESLPMIPLSVRVCYGEFRAHIQRIDLSDTSPQNQETVITWR